MKIHFIIDLIPFLMGSFILLFGLSKVTLNKPISLTILSATAIYLVAQSSWFSALLANDLWGRDFANYMWFLFNTLTMGIFIWTLYRLQ